jgi:GTP-binding protein
MVLIDSRLEFQTSDKNFIRWLASQQLPFAVILTKIDKLSSSQLKKQMNYYEKEFTGMFEENPNIFPTSSTEKKGKEYLLEFFEYLLNDSKNESSFTEK